MPQTFKKCFKCGECKPLEDYYAHPMMKDGHLNKCKDCAKRDATLNRYRRYDYYLSYDRSRERRSCKPAPAFQRRAHTAVQRAVRRGKLEKRPCEKCGSTDRVESHHQDYSKPLDVVWLCVKHHHELHRKPETIELLKQEGIQN